ncbi:MAG TPA: hypothetical protein VHY22_15130 [Chthoniobacteraceae bacterium]|nr:hypothetical protein [Chthoniobacteraceae bacterium]
MTFLSILILLVGGWGIAARLLPAGHSLAMRLAHAWLLGAFAVSLLMTLFGGILSGALLAGAVSLVMLSAGISSFRIPVPRGLPKGAVEWALCAVILCECLFLARFAQLTAIAWDGLTVWEIKARIALANGGSLPLDYFSDATRVWSHPDYPLMLPMLETWIYLWLGVADQSAVRILFPCFYLAAILLLYSGVAELSGKRWWGLLIAALLFFIPFFTDGNTNAFTGYADFPLAVLYLAAVLALITYLRQSSVPSLILFAVYAAALPWMKREGAILWLCLMLVAGAGFLKRRRLRHALLAALPGLLVILGWKLALAAARTVPNTDFLPINAANIRHHLDRIPIIAQWVAREIISIHDWSLLWPLCAIALLTLAIKGNRGMSLRLLVLIGMPLSIYSGIYILSSWQPFESHVACSLDRLVSQLALVALLTIGIAF